MSLSERLNQLHGDNWRIDLMEPDLREIFNRFRQALSLEENPDEFVCPVKDDWFVRQIKSIVWNWAAAAREDAEHNDLLAFNFGVASGYREALQDCQSWASGRANLADRLRRDKGGEFYEAKQVDDEPSGDPF